MNEVVFLKTDGKISIVYELYKVLKYYRGNLDYSLKWQAKDFVYKYFTDDKQRETIMNMIIDKLDNMDGDFSGKLDIDSWVFKDLAEIIGDKEFEKHLPNKEFKSPKPNYFEKPYSIGVTGPGKTPKITHDFT
jgi:hypothetical protein